VSQSQGPYPRAETLWVLSSKLLCLILQVAYARRLLQACTDEQNMAKDKPLVHFCDLLLQVGIILLCRGRCIFPLSSY